MPLLKFIRPTAPVSEDTHESIDAHVVGSRDWIGTSRPLNRAQFHAQVRKLAAAGYTDKAIARHIGVGLNLVRSILTGDTPEPPEAA